MQHWDGQYGLEVAFFLLENHLKATLPKFSNENPLKKKSICQIMPFLRSELPQVCLLVTILMLIEKSIAN
jgi:hypothetical protein